MPTRNQNKIYYQKRVNFFALLRKIKLWPSRKGILHGIKTFELSGDKAAITTHCGETFVTYNSRNSRAARWLRNKWVVAPCERCRIPTWKVEKYAKTFFKRGWGSRLQSDATDPADNGLT